MWIRTGSLSVSACVLAVFFWGCGKDSKTSDDVGPCAGGRFLLDFSESLFVKGTPIFPCADELVLDDESASIENGCDPVSAQVQATARGLGVEAKWDRCGGAAGDDPACIFDAIRLTATSRMEPDGPDCSILEGTITSGTPPAGKSFRACRVEAPSPFPPACTAPSVDTSSGPLCGLEQTVPVSGPEGNTEKPVNAYLGIRYAEAGRWEDPTPFESDRPVRATQFGHACPQGVKNIAREAQSEDCLYLNVWTPESKGNPLLPVMVFLHGGGFIANASSFPVYDGRHLAAVGGVVVVTANYRLGALGFLGGGFRTNRLHGNYGFLDQVEALKWVQKNIRRFGGDPGRVTLFGQSAGAMSVGLHLISPVSRDLFRAAIMESNPYGIPFKRRRQGMSSVSFSRSRRGVSEKALPA